MPGRVTGWKGHSIAIDAMVYLRDNSKDEFELFFVGPTDNLNLKNNLLKKIKDLNLEDAIKFVQPTKEMNLIYSIADIVLSCSTDPEAFGRIPVEAQAMGKVIIASNHGGHIETITMGLSGFLYQVRSYEGLGDSIIEAVSSPLYLDKSYNIKRRELILENFTVQKMCEETLRIYNNVLSKK